MPIRIEAPNLQVKNQPVEGEDVEIHDREKKYWYLGPALGPVEQDAPVRAGGFDLRLALRVRPEQ